MSIVTYREEVEMPAEFAVQQVLELACAAQRTNKDYLKESQSVYADDGQFLFLKFDNKSLIKFALGLFKSEHQALEFSPQAIFIEDVDKELASDIRKYFRKLMFAAVEGSNEFLTEVNVLLNSDTMPANKIGFIACLPSVYVRDYTQSQFEKKIKTLEDGYLGYPGTVLIDKDCEILECKRSKNFDAWNIYAIIDNKMVSWMGKKEAKLGPAVVSGAKVKDHNEHWKYKNSVTRLNYVKVFQ
jgi:hypothetical protein